MTRPMGRPLLGAVSGLGATVAMSGVMLAALRLIGKQPPEQIVETGVEVAGVPEPDQPEPVTTQGRYLAHHRCLLLTAGVGPVRAR
jgi:hypothetical protein